MRRARMENNVRTWNDEVGLIKYEVEICDLSNELYEYASNIILINYKFQIGTTS